MLLLVTRDQDLLDATGRAGVPFRHAETTAEAIAHLDAGDPLAPRAAWLVAYGPDILDDPRQRAVPDVTGSIAVHVPRVHGRGADMSAGALRGMVRLGLHTLVALPVGVDYLRALVQAQAVSAARTAVPA